MHPNVKFLSNNQMISYRFQSYVIDSLIVIL